VLIIDRVLCDRCGQFMGQLYRQPAPQPDRLPDLLTAPEYAICPDCLDAAEVIDDPSLAQ